MIDELVWTSVKRLRDRSVPTSVKSDIIYDKKSNKNIFSVFSYAKKKENKPKWTQSYAAVYDPASQSVKLVFWKQYLESYLANDLEARKTKKLPEQTVVYDPKTKGVKLQLLSEYLKVRDRRIDLEDCSWGDHIWYTWRISPGVAVLRNSRWTIDPS